MACRAAPHPWGALVRDLTVVGGAPDVAEIPCDVLPFRPVLSVRTSKRVRDFVQQNLMHLVVVEPLGEVPRNSDATLRVVAKSRAAFRVVEAKRPAPGPKSGVEVVADQRFRPHTYFCKFAHGCG